MFSISSIHHPRVISPVLHSPPPCDLSAGGSVRGSTGWRCCAPSARLCRVNVAPSTSVRRRPRYRADRPATRPIVRPDLFTFFFRSYFFSFLIIFFTIRARRHCDYIHHEWSTERARNWISIVQFHVLLFSVILVFTLKVTKTNELECSDRSAWV